MFVMNDKPAVYFDVDSTLVFTAQEAPLGMFTFVKIKGREFYVHDLHVEALKDFNARGHNVIVWSQGGAAWAKTVIKKLCLEDYVTACLSKPNWIFDDKPVWDWLGEHTRSYMEVSDECA